MCGKGGWVEESKEISEMQEKHGNKESKIKIKDTFFCTPLIRTIGGKGKG